MTTSERPDTQLSIGELARCAGITSRAVRHYHATGLLPEPLRDASGYRRYGPGDLVRLVHICRLRALGTPTDQIDRMLAEAPDPGTDLPAAVHALAVDVEAEIDRLQGVHHRLMALTGSHDLEEAAELLSAGLRSRDLLDLEQQPDLGRPVDEDEEDAESFVDDQVEQDTVDLLLQRFRAVQEEGVEQLAHDLAASLPGQRGHPLEPPMTDRRSGNRYSGNGFIGDRYSDDRLNRAQRDCVLRLGTLLHARSQAAGSSVDSPALEAPRTGPRQGASSGDDLSRLAYSVSGTGSGAGCGPTAEASTRALGTDS